MPGLQALLIQGVSFALVFGIAYGLAAFRGIQLTVAPAAALQGTLAAIISRRAGMARWWLLIQFLFPPAAIIVQAFHLPPWIFLSCFIVLLALYWTTFRTRVPFYPSNRTTWEAVARLLPAGRPIRFVDIGSGFGGLVLHLARQRPESDFSGIEVAPLPWFVAQVRARVGRRAANFVRDDYERLDLVAYDVVFAYLSPAAMPALGRKAHSEMRRGSLLLSYEFPIHGMEPDILIQPVKDGPCLYGWHL